MDVPWKTRIRITWVERVFSGQTPGGESECASGCQSKAGRARAIIKPTSTHFRGYRRSGRIGFADPTGTSLCHFTANRPRRRNRPSTRDAHPDAQPGGKPEATGWRGLRPLRSSGLRGIENDIALASSDSCSRRQLARVKQSPCALQQAGKPGVIRTDLHQLGSHRARCRKPRAPPTRLPPDSSKRSPRR